MVQRGFSSKVVMSWESWDARRLTFVDQDFRQLRGVGAEEDGGWDTTGDEDTGLILREEAVTLVEAVHKIGTTDGAARGLQGEGEE